MGHKAPTEKGKRADLTWHGCVGSCVWLVPWLLPAPRLLVPARAPGRTAGSDWGGSCLGVPGLMPLSLCLWVGVLLCLGGASFLFLPVCLCFLAVGSLVWSAGSRLAARALAPWALASFRGARLGRRLLCPLALWPGRSPGQVVGWLWVARCFFFLFLWGWSWSCPLLCLLWGWSWSCPLVFFLERKLGCSLAGGPVVVAASFGVPRLALSKGCLVSSLFAVVRRASLHLPLLRSGCLWGRVVPCAVGLGWSGCRPGLPYPLSPSWDWLLRPCVVVGVRAGWCARGGFGVGLGRLGPVGCGCGGRGCGGVFRARGGGSRACAGLRMLSVPPRPSAVCPPSWRCALLACPLPWLAGPRCCLFCAVVASRALGPGRPLGPGGPGRCVLAPGGGWVGAPCRAWGGVWCPGLPAAGSGWPGGGGVGVASRRWGPVGGGGVQGFRHSLSGRTGSASGSESVHVHSKGGSSHDTPVSATFSAMTCATTASSSSGGFLRR